MKSGHENMRITIVLYRDSPRSGGSFRIGQMVAHELLRLGVDVSAVCAYGEPGPLSTTLGGNCHFLRASGPRDLGRWRATRKLFQDLNSDVFHFIDSVFWMQSAMVGVKYKRILHIHGIMPQEVTRSKWPPMYSLYTRSAAALVCVNKANKNHILLDGLSTPDKVHTIYNAIDVDMWSNVGNKMHARRELGLPSRIKIAGVVGRLVESKGCLDAIELLSRLDESWHLAFCGDGELKAELVRRADNRQVAGRLHFVGILDDPRPFYAAVDCILCMSHYESFGLSMCESMAARVPVYGILGLGEYTEADWPLITEANSCFVARKSDIDTVAATDHQLAELARMLNEFNDQSLEVKQRTDIARQWVTERFSSVRYGKECLQLYQTVCALI